MAMIFFRKYSILLKENEYSVRKVNLCILGVVLFHLGTIPEGKIVLPLEIFYMTARPSVLLPGAK